MKVLWFSPTPSLAEDYLNNQPTNGGWIRSLEKEIRDKVDLSIAFYDYNNVKQYIPEAKTSYYPIAKKNDDFLSKVRTRIFKQLESEKDLEKFKEIINKVQPDLIHIHGTELPFGLIQHFSRIPTVISIQGILTVYEHKYFSGLSYLDILKYSGLKSRVFFTSALSTFKYFKKKSKRERVIYRASRYLIGRTEWDRRVASVLSPASTYFHNDEVLKDDFYAGCWENKMDDTLHLFTTTGSNIYKGIETLIHCADLLDACNIKFRWKVAGVSATDEIVSIVRKKMKKNISPNIQFMGKVFDDELKRSILGCHLYVSISHIENSPNSLCEALILGAPCIATHAGGIPTFIKNRDTGILIQDGDPYSMAGAIMELKDDDAFAARLGRNARKEALARHDKNKIAQDLLHIYEAILAQ